MSLREEGRRLKAGRAPGMPNMGNLSVNSQWSGGRVFAGAGVATVAPLCPHYLQKKSSDSSDSLIGHKASAWDQLVSESTSERAEHTAASAEATAFPCSSHNLGKSRVSSPMGSFLDKNRHVARTGVPPDDPGGGEAPPTREQELLEKQRDQMGAVVQQYAMQERIMAEGEAELIWANYQKLQQQYAPIVRDSLQVCAAITQRLLLLITTSTALYNQIAPYIQAGLSAPQDLIVQLQQITQHFRELESIAIQNENAVEGMKQLYRECGFMGKAMEGMDALPFRRMIDAASSRDQLGFAKAVDEMNALCEQLNFAFEVYMRTYSQTGGIPLPPKMFALAIRESERQRALEALEQQRLQLAAAPSAASGEAAPPSGMLVDGEEEDYDPVVQAPSPAEGGGENDDDDDDADDDDEVVQVPVVVNPATLTVQPVRGNDSCPAVSYMTHKLLQSQSRGDCFYDSVRMLLYLEDGQNPTIHELRLKTGHWLLDMSSDVRAPPGELQGEREQYNRIREVDIGRLAFRTTPAELPRHVLRYVENEVYPYRVWADMPMHVALGWALGRRICVYNNGIDQPGLSFGPDLGKPPLNVAYVQASNPDGRPGPGGRNHYQPIVPRSEATVPIPYTDVIDLTVRKRSNAVVTAPVLPDAAPVLPDAAASAAAAARAQQAAAARAQQADAARAAAARQALVPALAPQQDGELPISQEALRTLRRRKAWVTVQDLGMHIMHLVQAQTGCGGGFEELFKAAVVDPRMRTQINAMMVKHFTTFVWWEAALNTWYMQTSEGWVRAPAGTPVKDMKVLKLPLEKSVTNGGSMLHGGSSKPADPINHRLEDFEMGTSEDRNATPPRAPTAHEGTAFPSWKDVAWKLAGSSRTLSGWDDQITVAHGQKVRDEYVTAIAKRVSEDPNGLFGMHKNSVANFWSNDKGEMWRKSGPGQKSVEGPPSSVALPPEALMSATQDPWSKEHLTVSGETGHFGAFGKVEATYWGQEKFLRKGDKGVPPLTDEDVAPYLREADREFMPVRLKALARAEKNLDDVNEAQRLKEAGGLQRVYMQMLQRLKWTAHNYVNGPAPDPEKTVERATPWGYKAYAAATSALAKTEGVSEADFEKLQNEHMNSLIARVLSEVKPFVDEMLVLGLPWDSKIDFETPHQGAPCPTKPEQDRMFMSPQCATLAAHTYKMYSVFYFGKPYKGTGPTASSYSYAKRKDVTEEEDGGGLGEGGGLAVEYNVHKKYQSDVRALRDLHDRNMADVAASKEYIWMKAFDLPIELWGAKDPMHRLDPNGATRNYDPITLSKLHTQFNIYEGLYGKRLKEMREEVVFGTLIDRIKNDEGESIRPQVDALQAQTLALKNAMLKILDSADAAIVTLLIDKTTREKFEDYQNDTEWRRALSRLFENIGMQLIMAWESIVSSPLDITEMTYVNGQHTMPAMEDVQGLLKKLETAIEDACQGDTFVVFDQIEGCKHPLVVKYTQAAVDEAQKVNAALEKSERYKTSVVGFMSRFHPMVNFIAELMPALLSASLKICENHNARSKLSDDVIAIVNNGSGPDEMRLQLCEIGLVEMRMNAVTRFNNEATFQRHVQTFDKKRAECFAMKMGRPHANEVELDQTYHPLVNRSLSRNAFVAFLQSTFIGKAISREYIDAIRSYTAGKRAKGMQTVAIDLSKGMRSHAPTSAVQQRRLGGVSESWPGITKLDRRTNRVVYDMIKDMGDIKEYLDEVVKDCGSQYSVARMYQAEMERTLLKTTAIVTRDTTVTNFINFRRPGIDPETRQAITPEMEMPEDQALKFKFARAAVGLRLSENYKTRFIEYQRDLGEQAASLDAWQTAVALAHDIAGFRAWAAYAIFWSEEKEENRRTMTRADLEAALSRTQVEAHATRRASGMVFSGDLAGGNIMSVIQYYVVMAAAGENPYGTWRYSDPLRKDEEGNVELSTSLEEALRTYADPTSLEQLVDLEEVEGVGHRNEGVVSLLRDLLGEWTKAKDKAAEVSTGYFEAQELEVVVGPYTHLNQPYAVMLDLSTGAAQRGKHVHYDLVILHEQDAATFEHVKDLLYEFNSLDVTAQTSDVDLSEQWSCHRWTDASGRPLDSFRFTREQWMDEQSATYTVDGRGALPHVYFEQMFIRMQAGDVTLDRGGLNKWEQDLRNRKIGLLEGPNARFPEQLMDNTWYVKVPVGVVEVGEVPYLTYQWVPVLPHRKLTGGEFWVAPLAPDVYDEKIKKMLAGAPGVTLCPETFNTAKGRTVTGEMLVTPYAVGDMDYLWGVNLQEVYRQPDLMETFDYVNPLGVTLRDVMENLKGRRGTYRGSQDGWQLSPELIDLRSDAGSIVVWLPVALNREVQIGEIVTGPDDDPEKIMGRRFRGLTPDEIGKSTSSAVLAMPYLFPEKKDMMLVEQGPRPLAPSAGNQPGDPNSPAVSMESGDAQPDVAERRELTEEEKADAEKVFEWRYLKYKERLEATAFDDQAQFAAENEPKKADAARDVRRAANANVRLEDMIVMEEEEAAKRLARDQEEHDRVKRYTRKVEGYDALRKEVETNASGALLQRTGGGRRGVVTEVVDPRPVDMSNVQPGDVVEYAQWRAMRDAGTLPAGVAPLIGVNPRKRDSTPWKKPKRKPQMRQVKRVNTFICDIPLDKQRENEPAVFEAREQYRAAEQQHKARMAEWKTKRDDALSKKQKPPLEPVEPDIMRIYRSEPTPREQEFRYSEPVDTLVAYRGRDAYWDSDDGVWCFPRGEDDALLKTRTYKQRWSIAGRNDDWMGDWPVSDDEAWENEGLGGDVVSADGKSQWHNYFYSKEPPLNVMFPGPEPPVRPPDADDESFVFQATPYTEHLALMQAEMPPEDGIGDRNYFLLYNYDLGRTVSRPVMMPDSEEDEDL